MQKNEAKVTSNDLVDAELDALLNGLDDDGDDTAVIAKTTELPDGMQELEDSSKAIAPAKTKPAAKKPHAKIAKAKDDKAKPVTATKSAKPKVADSSKPVKEKKAPKPRLNLAGMKPSAAIITILGDNMDLLVLSEEERGFSPQKMRPLIDKRLAGYDELAKKQGEKVVNMFKWLHDGSKLKAFTAMAIKHLIDKGEVTSASLKQHYIDRPYGAGTANSVSNQMMTLLPELGIAERDGKTLTLVKDSTIVAKFTAAA